MELEPFSALLSLEQLVRSLNDARALHSFYFEFGRRLYTLKLVLEYCPPGSEVVDLGASPFIVSCALARMGYKVTAVDYDPAEYSTVASACGVKTVRADLERDRLDLADASVDCAVFAEVLEHLNPYYVGHTMSEVSRVLKLGGKLILTTPNIASLFRRLRLLLGVQPQYVTHVHEYTRREVVELLERYGFRVLEARYSEVNDLTLVDAEPGEYVKPRSYRDLLKLTARKPTKLNMLRALVYPLVKAIPSLRMLIVVVAEKTSYIESSRGVARW
ncbi:MAG: class I SAM-dependent methyltransferase [Nitrososphaerota archaeon]